MSARWLWLMEISLQIPSRELSFQDKLFRLGLQRVRKEIIILPSIFQFGSVYISIKGNSSTWFHMLNFKHWRIQVHIKSFLINCLPLSLEIAGIAFIDQKTQSRYRIFEVYMLNQQSFDITYAANHVHANSTWFSRNALWIKQYLQTFRNLLTD